MKRTLLYILLLLGSVSIKAQTINGIVYRDSTQTVITGASVYYGGSMAGTVTNKDGRFELQAKSQQIPITVSCIGYYSATAYYKTGQPLIIYLKPKVEELQDVVIHADGMDRKNEVAIFTREFLGTSEYAKSCVIKNMDDIDLFYNKKTKTLIGSSDKPIIIENKKLGYTVSCYMDKFEKAANEVHFSGNYIFKENKAANTKTQAAIQENREDAYDGSRMQLIRALWHLTLNRTFFDLYTLKRDIVRPEYSNLQESDLVVIDSLGQKYLRFQGSIYVGDSRSYRKTSILTFNSPLSFIDKDGFYGAGLEWSGPLGNQRVGDMLPLEYQSEREARSVAKAPLKAIAKTNLNNTSKQEMLFEKAYLHTDRDVYAMGDTLWFKAYLVNAQDHKPTAGSGNLYVELLAPDSAKILDSEIIRLEKGLGNGDIALDDSLKAGTYRLRAYTNWMRNFSDNFVFEKEITILNTQAVPDTPDPKATVKNNKKGKPATATATQNKIVTVTQNTAPDILPVIRFYPEGGSLVQGVSSFVGIKAEDGYGKGIPAIGSVIAASGDTVSHFTCDSLGIGVFTLLPLPGQSYHAMAALGNRHDQFQLPSALSKGLALQLKVTDTVIHALVHATGTSDNSVSMLVKHNGKTVLSQQLQLKEAQAAFKINTADIPEGISAITIYDKENKPECERLVYIHPEQNKKNKISISTDKKIYQPKEKVTLTIQTQPNSNLSMAVVDAGVVPVQQGDIISYLNLQSELRGAIESPNRYFDTTNINRAKQLDQLLLTQGWRDFVWRRMADTAIRISYAAEDGISVSGKIWDEVRNKMLPAANVTLYADSAKGAKLFSTTNDAEGRFHFNGLILYGQQNVKLGSVDNTGKDKGTILVDTLTPLPVKPIISRPAFFQNSLDSIAKVNTEKKVESMKAANLSGVTRLKEVTIKNKKTIVTRSMNILTSREPDQVLNIIPDDYQYKTLQWFMVQKIKGAHESSQPYHGAVPTGVEFSGSDTLLIKTPAAAFYVSQTVLMPPQIFVDGRELNMDGNTALDMNAQAEAYRTQYFNMPMNKFKKVVLKHMVGTIHGLSATGGALLPSAEFVNVDRFLLYLTMQDNFTLDNPGSLSINVNGYYQARTFYEPLPNAKPSIADYRSTIHWEPNIKTDSIGKATVNFYNALPKTRVRVIVQGISNDGLALSNVGGYEVN